MLGWILAVQPFKVYSVYVFESAIFKVMVEKVFVSSCMIQLEKRSNAVTKDVNEGVKHCSMTQGNP